MEFYDAYIDENDFIKLIRDLLFALESIGLLLFIIIHGNNKKKIQNILIIFLRKYG